MVKKNYLGVNVLEAARQRISWTFDTFPNIYLSFSGGKDSTAMLHLVMDEAIKRHRKVGLLLIDLEAQYRLTIEHALRCYEMYWDHIEPYWIALPIALRNAVSMYEPKWTCWEPGREKDWIRNPPKFAITDQKYFSFYRYPMEFEEFTPAFGHWLSQDETPTASFVGIRTDESLHRWRTIKAGKKQGLEGKQWTTWAGKGVYSVYPIYDWRTKDIWTYHAKTGKPYNNLYDRMHQAGLSIHQQRICQPYGDDQRKGLWLYHAIEPETWSKVVARVNGANSGALYSKESGNILGNLKISKPEGHTWESFAKLILQTLPESTAEHYRDKIAVFLKWYQDRGYPNGIPDEPPDPKKEVTRNGGPSWKRICKALLRHDYWCKGLSFSQTKSDAYQRYKKIMKTRRKRWNIQI